MFNQKHMMRQMQKMQEALQKAQEDLALREVEGTAGGGLVRVSVSGHLEPKSVKIDKSAVDPEDVETLEDLILVAFRDAITKAQELSSQQMSQFTGGLRIPGIF
ncbi:MAG: YbaB/EbfC family nucleoid-associated protein [Armatimonadetes bacterium]|nr:YbaB/EbfC family nucleoid-associated protein [Armatimonadota bacterium]